MGDISEMRGLVTVVTFLGMLVLLISWFPAQLYQATDAEKTVITPTVFESIDVWSYAETFNYLMNETGGSQLGQWYFVDDSGLDIGSRDLQFYYIPANQSNLRARVLYHYYVWIIFPALEALHWYNDAGVDRGTEIDVSEMELDTQDNETVKYRLVSERFGFQYIAHYGFNSTTYGNFTEAWNFHGLHFFLAVNFDQVNTSYNAFQLVGMLLFFQLPNVHWVLNAIIAIPIWVCIAYLVFILFLRAIGAIFGGGA